MTYTARIPQLRGLRGGTVVGITTRTYMLQGVQLRGQSLNGLCHISSTQKKTTLKWASNTHLVVWTYMETACRVISKYLLSQANMQVFSSLNERYLAQTNRFIRYVCPIVQTPSMKPVSPL